jgi:hypothetical protein
MKLKSLFSLVVIITGFVFFLSCGSSSTSTCTGNACPKEPAPMNTSGASATAKSVPLELSRYLQQMKLNTLSTSNVEPSLTGAITSLSGDFTFSGPDIPDRARLTGKIVFYDFKQVFSTCNSEKSEDPALTMELIESGSQSVIQSPVAPSNQEVTIDFTKSYIVRVNAKLASPCTSFGYSFVILVK